MHPDHFPEQQKTGNSIITPAVYSKKTILSGVELFTSPETHRIIKTDTPYNGIFIIDTEQYLSKGVLIMERVYDFLKKAGVYYLATMDGDQPRVRPFGTIDLFEGKLYIQTGKIKPVANQMKANQKVEISAMADGKWIRITAEAVLDERLEAQKHMLDAYPSLLNRYQPGDGNTEVYYLKNASAQICSFTEPPVEITF